MSTGASWVHASISAVTEPSSLVSFGAANGSFINTQLPELTSEWTNEVWPSTEPWQAARHTLVKVRYNRHYTFGKIEFPNIATSEIHAATRQAYQALAEYLKDSEHKNLIRIWNLVPDINEGHGDQETYRQFSLGRAEVFGDYRELLGNYTAASALGRDIPGLLVYFLASSEPGTPVENPEQISAYHYPRCHGPASPSFARGTVHRHTLYVSGTAAIEGHESQFSGDIEKQCQLALLNIDRVVTASSLTPGKGYLRGYLRNPVDLGVAQKVVQASIFSKLPVVWLQADICRRELLVEFEGVLT